MCACACVFVDGSLVRPWHNGRGRDCVSFFHFPIRATRRVMLSLSMVGLGQRYDRVYWVLFFFWSFSFSDEILVDFFFFIGDDVRVATCTLARISQRWERERERGRAWDSVDTLFIIVVVIIICWKEKNWIKCVCIGASAYHIVCRVGQ